MISFNLFNFITNSEVPTLLDLAAICGLTASSNWNRQLVLVSGENRVRCLSSASSNGPVDTGFRYQVVSAGNFLAKALQRIVDIIVLPTFVLAPYIW